MNAVSGQCALIVSALHTRGPATAGEIAAAIDSRSRNDVARNLSRLCVRGLVEATPRRRCAVSSRVAQTWRLTELAPRRNLPTLHEPKGQVASPGPQEVRDFRALVVWARAHRGPVTEDILRLGRWLSVSFEGRQ